MKEGEDIDIEFTGLKPGEKLYEEVQHFDEVHKKTDHKQIFRFSAHVPIEEDLDRVSSELMTVIKSHDVYQKQSEESFQVQPIFGRLNF